MTLASSREQSAYERKPLGAWPPEDLEHVARCPVCGASERTLLHGNLTDRVFFCAPGVWTLYACGNCGSGYLDPRPTPASIGRAYSQYFTHSEGYHAPTDTLSVVRRLRRALANGYRNRKFGTRARLATIFGVPLAYLVPGMRENLDIPFRYAPKPIAGARLLDIGAGNGDFLELARSAGWKVQGVEPDAKAAAVCRARKLDVRIGGIEQLAEERECFDYITISHVIEHVHDPRRLLASAFDLLKPGGCLFIDTPNIDAFGHTRYGDAWPGLDPPRHLVLFNWRSLEYILHNTGFVDITCKPRTVIYAELSAQSRALAHGRDCYLEKISWGDRVTSYILAVRTQLKHKHSEYVTLLAHKPARCS